MGCHFKFQDMKESGIKRKYFYRAPEMTQQVKTIAGKLKELRNTLCKKRVNSY